MRSVEISLTQSQVLGKRSKYQIEAVITQADIDLYGFPCKAGDTLDWNPYQWAVYIKKGKPPAVGAKQIRARIVKERKDRLTGVYDDRTNRQLIGLDDFGYRQSRAGDYYKMKAKQDKQVKADITQLRNNWLMGK